MGTGVALQFHSLCFSIISLVVFVFLNYLRCFARRPSVLGPLRGVGDMLAYFSFSLVPRFAQKVSDSEAGSSPAARRMQS